MNARFNQSGSESVLRAVLAPLILWRRNLRARRHFWTESSQDACRKRFYQQFLGPGDLVFDIGANIGERSKAFHSLGARVIAIEPQKGCAAVLENHFRHRRRFTLIPCALGAAAGEAEMAISTSSTLSSLSRDWIQSVRRSGRMGAADWTGSERVPVRTFDSLIAQFGVPRFAKIDVEGFESEVLCGLSRPVPVLSFEFTPEFEESTVACIRRLREIGSAEFQISLGESMAFHLPGWVGGDQILDEVGRVPRECFGDIYARFAKAV